MTDYKALAAPFPAEDIEWRVQQAGKSGDKIWAMVLAYITARAIHDRLDEVVGPQFWKNEYREIPGGWLCGLSLWDGEAPEDDKWVTKWDGAENTDIEPTKGGLSGAFKRAAVLWGIGRYLYHLDAGFADVSMNKQQGWHRTWDKKLNTTFYWKPPVLPAWALPEGQKQEPNGLVDDLDRQLRECTTSDAMSKVGAKIREAWPKLSIHDRERLTATKGEVLVELANA